MSTKSEKNIYYFVDLVIVCIVLNILNLVLILSKISRLETSTLYMLLDIMGDFCTHFVTQNINLTFLVGGWVK